MTTTPVAAITEIAENQDSSEVTANEAFRRLEQGARFFAVISATTTSPPGSPSDGDAYLLASGTPSGDWAGHEDELPYYQSTAWEFREPQDGDLVFSTDTGLWYQYSAENSPVGWNQVGRFVDLADAPDDLTAHYALKVNSSGTALVLTQFPADFACFKTGTLGSSEVLLRYSIARGAIFPANFAGSYAEATVAATGSTTLIVAVNGSQIGTIVFAASGTVATFTTDGGTDKTLARGDILTITAPGSADGTLANVSITLAGYRNGTDS